MDQIFGLGRYQKLTKPNKNWGFKNRVSPKRALQNLNFLSWTHEIFKVSRCKEKLKFDQVWGNQNGGPS